MDKERINVGRVADDWALNYNLTNALQYLYKAISADELNNLLLMKQYIEFERSEIDWRTRARRRADKVYRRLAKREVAAIEVAEVWGLSEGLSEVLLYLHDYSKRGSSIDLEFAEFLLGRYIYTLIENSSN